MPPPIYHLVPKQRWEQLGESPYEADSLASQGFIHCSYQHQVAVSANRFYAKEEELLVLTIDPAILTSPLREEEATSGERFPHIYGPIHRAAVVDVQSLHRDESGAWTFPSKTQRRA
jgi:uncharacterized protein (DUF952 family)